MTIGVGIQYISRLISSNGSPGNTKAESSSSGFVSFPFDRVWLQMKGALFQSFHLLGFYPSPVFHVDASFPTKAKKGGICVPG